MIRRMNEGPPFSPGMSLVSAQKTIVGTALTVCFLGVQILAISYFRVNTINNQWNMFQDFA